jgi:hypothetical protein
MKVFSRVMIGLGLLLGSGVCAMADILWTFDDVYFTNGNELTGWFTTDNTVDAVDSFSIDVTGPATEAAFTATQMVNAYLPNEIGIANADFSEYVDFELPTSLTSLGGTIDLTQGYDCPGCGVLIVNADHTPTVTGVTGVAADFVPTPEPSSIPFLGAGVVLMGLMMRRKPIRAS